MIRYLMLNNDINKHMLCYYKREQDQVFNDMNSMLENENQYQLFF